MNNEAVGELLLLIKSVVCSSLVKYTGKNRRYLQTKFNDFSIDHEKLQYCFLMMNKRQTFTVCSKVVKMLAQLPS